MQEYPIYIGNQSLSQLQLDISAKAYSNVVVLLDENTYRDCYPILKDHLPEKHHWIGIYAGEAHKTLSTCEKIWEQLTSCYCDRNTLLINLGGGVIGDMGGFVAGVYKRGIDFVQVPTTLLAQTDASVGSKVGIDFHLYKNQIGLFIDPQAVYICPVFLNTLPKRQLLSGFGEVVKHYLISDKAGWDELKTQAFETLDFEKVIQHSVATKSAIVAQDKMERNIRKALNFGHTVGHAVESYFLGFDSEAMFHGEAVAAGMICESHLSFQKGYLSETELEEITAYLLQHFWLPEMPPFIYKRIYQLMQQDKKNQGDEVMCVLLKEIGKVKWNEPVEKAQLLAALHFYNEKIKLKK
ncbi:MAG: 3-dehydroquinate synthase [Bacteroidia bacterium]